MLCVKEDPEMNLVFNGADTVVFENASDVMNT